MIKDWIDQREQLEITLSDCMSEYCKKYFLKLYKNGDESKKMFQKAVAKIPTWSRGEKERQMKRFKKWLHASHTFIDQPEGVQHFLNKYVVYSLRIMLHKYDASSIYEEPMPCVDDVLYMCLKRLGRYFYEHPKTVVKPSKDMDKIIKECLQSFIPVQKVIQIIQQTEEVKSLEYNFDDESSNSVSTKSVREHPKIVVYKQESEGSEAAVGGMKYVSSDEMDDFQMSEQSQKAKLSEDDDVKHIKIPIVKRKGFKGF